MSKETPNPSNRNREDGNVAHQEIGHSGNAGLEFPVNPYRRDLQEAVDEGDVNTEAPETTEQLPDGIRVDHEYDTEPTPPPEKNSRKGIIAAGLAGAVALTGTLAFVFGRNSDEEPTPTPSRPAATSSPNPGQSNPVVIRPTTTAEATATAETPGGAAEQKARTYELAHVPDSVLDLKKLKEYVAPAEVIDTYKQLIPNYGNVMAEHMLSLTTATPERIADARQRISTAMNATYTRLGENGTPERVDAGEFFNQVAFSPGIRMEDYEADGIRGEGSTKAEAVATFMAGNTMEYQPALDIAAEQLVKLSTYAKENPDETFKPSDIGPSDIADLGFLIPSNFNTGEIVANADQQDLIVNGTRAHLVRVYDTPDLMTKVAADGKTKSDMKAFTFISELAQPGHEKTVEIVVTTAVAVPVDVRLDESTAAITGEKPVDDVTGEGYFQLMVTHQTPFHQ